MRMLSVVAVDAAGYHVVSCRAGDSRGVESCCVGRRMLQVDTGWSWADVAWSPESRMRRAENAYANGVASRRVDAAGHHVASRRVRIELETVEPESASSATHCANLL